MRVVQTSTLIGPPLGWAGAKCMGRDVEPHVRAYGASFDVYVKQVDADFYDPSTNWLQGGSIIERENITIRALWDNGRRRTGNEAWRADIDFVDGRMTFGELCEYGPTPQVAAMRCYVASKLGHQVEIPEELFNE